MKNLDVVRAVQVSRPSIPKVTDKATDQSPSLKVKAI